MELTALPNIGPVLAEELHRVGVDTPEALRTLGAEEAFLRLKVREPDSCFHKLTALEGAVQGVRKSLLTPERKAELRTFFDGLSK